jgi:amino acid permease
LAIFCPSDYIVPTSIHDVISILKTHSDNAKILAGGRTIHELASRGMIPQVFYDDLKPGLKLPATSDYAYTTVAPTAI